LVRITFSSVTARAEEENKNESTRGGARTPVHTITSL
jgi:hypothetical protein